MPGPELGCSKDDLNTIYLSGLLHDIGKIGIDDNVLRKPGPLTPEELEHIKTHPELGCRILDGVKQLDQVLPVVRHHHEAWNGGGYPDGLKGEECPFLARIVAVADSIDAMSSDRPYRKGMPDEKLDSILRDGAGKQWDAQVIEAAFRVRDELRRIGQTERKPLRARRRPLASGRSAGRRRFALRSTGFGLSRTFRWEASPARFPALIVTLHRRRDASHGYLLCWPHGPRRIRPRRFAA